MNTSPGVVLSQRQGAGRDIADLLKLAWPMIVVAVAVSFSQNIQTAILGHGVETTSIYWLSMLQPFSFLFLAILECLAISNQVFSARSVNLWSRHKVLKATLILSALGILLVALLSGTIALTSTWLERLLPVSGGGFYQEALPLYFLSTLPFIQLEMCNSALRGQGKSALSMLLVIVYIALNASICYTSYHVYDLGFYSIILANALASGLLIPVATWLVWRVGHQQQDDRPQAFTARLKGLIQQVGLPIFASFIVVFISSLLVFPLIGTLGEQYVAAFLIITKIRMFIVIPAVACGSALAILINQRLAISSGEHLKRLLHRGLMFIGGLYLLLTLGVYWGEATLIGILSGDGAIRDASRQMMLILLPTFFLTACVASLQALLEQLDQARRVLILTVIIELLMVIVLLAGWERFSDLNSMMSVIILFSAINFLAFANEYWRLANKIGSEHVI
ncbi:MATE family efflux transporter [Pseudomonas maumuensis]|uniref:MATE family efflux transporter n=1 Tax=Pseudomonas maumuensis TaxID=2842354 RepID=A0ABX8NPW3_9PSED|nr:MATE family efflux transporter [Pseudomonas maumuensis]QXH58074.1 MATE family efflux transporter [Pseudomonas maumuensis]